MTSNRKRIAAPTAASGMAEAQGLVGVAIGQERAEIRPHLVTALSQLGGNTQAPGDMP
jgi:hypothetical protein